MTECSKSNYVKCDFSTNDGNLGEKLLQGLRRKVFEIGLKNFLGILNENDLKRFQEFYNHLSTSEVLI